MMTKKFLNQAFIAHFLSKFYNVNIFQKSNKQTFVKARFIAMYIMRDRGYSLKEIGDFFGMDHTSVLYGINRAQERITMPNMYPDYYRDFNNLKSEMKV